MDIVYDFIQKGGFTTWAIVTSAVALVILGSDRLLALFFKFSHNTLAEEETIRSLLLGRRYTEAVQICNRKELAPNLSVMKQGLLAVESGREAMRSALGGAVLQVTHKCESKLGYLALIANVATLLGLLGTITGLMTTFKALSAADPAKKGEMLGAGISEAMYSTAAGLIVGVIAMVIHTMCVSKSDDIIGRSQDAGLKLITWVEQSERAPGHVGS